MTSPLLNIYSTINNYTWEPGNLKACIQNYKEEKKNKGIDNTSSMEFDNTFSVDYDENDTTPPTTPLTNDEDDSIQFNFEIDEEHYKAIQAPLKLAKFEDLLRQNFESAKNCQMTEENKNFKISINTDGINHSTVPVSTFHYGEASVTGINHNRSEDRHLVAQIQFEAEGRNYRGNLAGVFDGHGSDVISEFCKKNFTVFFQVTLEMHNQSKLTDYGIGKALRSSFKWLHRMSPEQNLKRGSTALVTFVFENKVWTANAGDCRAVFIASNQAKKECDALSEDSLANNPYFAKKVKKLGGTLSLINGELRVVEVSKNSGKLARVGSSLEVTRSIGDHWLKGDTGDCCISPEPKITCYPTDNGLLILASDGLWKVCSTNELGVAIETIKKVTMDYGKMAAMLASSAKVSGSMDDISVLVIPFE